MDIIKYSGLAANIVIIAGILFVVVWLISENNEFTEIMTELESSSQEAQDYVSNSTSQEMQNHIKDICFRFDRLKKADPSIVFSTDERNFISDQCTTK